MNKNQLLSAVMAGALALYAPSTYVEASTATKAKVVAGVAKGKSGKGKGKVIVSPLERKLNALDGRVAGLAKDVTDVTEQYKAVGARVGQLERNGYIAEDLRDALGDKYAQLQGLHKAVDDECGKAYTSFVALAKEASATYNGLDGLATKVADLSKDATLSTYAMAVEAQKLFSAELSSDDNNDEFKVYLSNGLTATSNDKPISVTAQYEKCVAAQETQVGEVKKFRGLLGKNLLRDEAELRRTIEEIVTEKMPAAVEAGKSRWSIKALAGAGYFGNGSAHSFPVAVTGELCYAFTPAVGVCANGTVYQNGESRQTVSSTPESKTSAVGGSLGYQQQSTLSLQQTTGTDYHNGAGLRLAYNTGRKVGFGLSLQALNGQETVTNDQTRSVVLRNSAGVQLGDVSSVSDLVTTRRAVHPIVPGVDVTVGFAKGFGARVSAGYDLTTGKVMSFIQAIYKF